MKSGKGEFASIIDILRHHADHRPDHAALIFDDGTGPVERVSYAELLDRSLRLGGAMAERGLGGRPAALLFDQGLDFVIALIACFSIGAIAVPIAPQGRRRERVANLLPLLLDCDPAAVILDGGMARQYEDLPERLAGTSIQCIGMDSLPTDGRAPLAPAALAEDHPAVLQYTSGSTSAPKGVIISHGNLIANQRMIQASFGHNQKSDFVGWAPHFHDQGLFGNILQPLYLGSTCVLTSPAIFVRRPLVWLEMIDRYQAHTSGGPNFAFDLCTESALQKGLPDVDLSSWKVAFNGAEPIRASSLERFAEAFASVGFRKASLFPCFGLAECTVVTACGPRDKEPVMRAAKADRRERVTGEEDLTLADVCSGAIMDEAEVIMVDTDSLLPVPEGSVGEVWVAGPHVGQGYWRNDAATQATFGARLADGRGPYLRTGDLGYSRAEGVYIVGRIKDLLIVRGRNYAPSDIEQIWTDVSGSVGQAAAAAVEVTHEGVTHVVLVAEIERSLRHAPDFDEQAAGFMVQIRKAGVERLDLSISDIVLVAPGNIPRTTSGKVKRSEARRMLEQGLLSVAYASGSFAKAWSAMAG